MRGVVRSCAPSPGTDVCARREVQIGTMQAGELGGAQAGVHRECEEGVVAATGHVVRSGAASRASTSTSDRKVTSRRGPRLSGIASTRAMTAACPGWFGAA